MEGTLETLVSYVPPQVAQLYAASDEPLSAPRAEHYPGATLLADITGFTALTERLAALGPDGAEKLTQLLNAYFGQLVDVVLAHGGEVVKFAGDGLLAIWRADAEDLATVTLRAAQCGVAVQMQFRDYETGEGERLELTISIGAGDVVAAHVGGVNGRWEFLTAGDPMVQVSAVEEHAQPGNVILSPEAWVLVEEHCGGHPLPSGSVRLYDLRRPLPLQAAAPTKPPKAEASLRPYVPLAVTARLDAGHTGWMAELRRLTVMFVNVHGIDATAPSVLDRLQAVVQEIQQVLARFEGTINKLIVEQRGTACVAAFGLPPLTHEDDSSRAVYAAIELHESLTAMGLRCDIGIASGQAFCGPVGGERRREYTMIGDVVNVAARLMQSAVDDLWCDRATYRAVQDRVSFATLPEITVKGKAKTVAVYRPDATKAGVRRDPRALVGRTEELAQLDEALAALRQGRGGVVLLVGEAGIGKSRLVDELLTRANAVRVASLEGAADAMEQTTPYHAWRAACTHLLGLDAFDHGAARQEQVRASLGDMPEVLRLWPLLNGVLPLDLPDSDLTKHMTGKVRADNTRLLLAQILKRTAAAAPLLLVLEDVHWMDSASWALTLEVHREVPDALLVLATRPMGDQAPAEFTHLAHARGTVRLDLGPLPEEDTLALVCARLGVDRLPDTAAALIRDRAQGNPFFSEELAYALRDAGYLQITDGTCTVAPDAGDLSRLSLPDTVQGVVTSRIDRLSPAQQLALKAASVIGRVFAFRVLRDIYPVESDRPLLQDYLEAMHSLDLTLIETPEPNLSYIFKHVILHEVAYNLMLQAQREQLHRAAAEWYEETYAEDLPAHYPLLAHHWLKANVPAKALEYSAAAGEQALAKGADQEAVHFFTQALDLDAALGADHAPAHVPVRRARWERQLAEARYNQGQIVEARPHLLNAMTLLGWPMPETRGARIRTIAHHAAVQALHRWFPARFFGRAGDQAERAVEVVRCHLLIGEIHYLNGDLVPFLVNSLCGLNFAEWAGESPELMRVYAGGCLVVGAIPLHGLAETYSRRAQELALRMDDLAARGFSNMSCSVYYMNSAQWDRVHERLAVGIPELSRVGFNRIWTLCLSVRFLSLTAQGEYDRAEEAIEEMRTVVRRSGSAEHHAWVQLNQAVVLLRRGGKLAEAADRLREGVNLLEGQGDHVHLLRGRGLLAVVHLRQGHPYQAKAGADQVLAMATESASTSTVFEGLAGTAEVYLTLWQDGDASVADAARAACDALAKVGKKFRLAECRALAWLGWCRWLDGKPAAARKCWARALEAGERHATPYDRALTHYTLGRHMDRGDAHRRGHLEEAAAIFERIGAQDDLARARAELNA